MSKDRQLSRAARDTFEFWERQTALLAGREPLQVLEETPAILTHLIAGLTASQLQSRPVPDKWSILQIILHLSDMEWVFGFRIRTILGDEKPRLSQVDQASWVRVIPPEARSAAAELEAFGALRRLNLRLWRALSPIQLQRCGIHEETGVELSLERIREIQAGHDLSHLAQIENLLGSIP